MKKVLLIAALLGFTSLSYKAVAQEEKPEIKEKKEKKEVKERKEKKETQKIIWKRLLGKSFLTKREAFALIGFFKKIR